MLRNRSLDGLRGIAAMLVVILHVWMFSGRPELLLGVHWGKLSLAVIVFFVLSGYLIWKPFARALINDEPLPQLVTYIRHRVGRIVPLYMTALVASILILLGQQTTSLPEPQWWIAHFLFIQNYIPQAATKIDPPMWTLVIEMSFYLVLPLIGWLCTRRNFRSRRGQIQLIGGIMAVAFCYGIVAHTFDFPGTAIRTLPYFLPVFGCGMLLATMTVNRSLSTRQCAAALYGGITVVVVACLLPIAQGESTFFREMLAAVGFTGIIAYLASAGSRVLSWRPFVTLGTLSYGVYLWHFPIIYLLRTRDWWPDGFSLPLLIVSSLSLMTAAVTWKCIEEPGIRWARQRRTTRSRHRDSPSSEFVVST